MDTLKELATALGNDPNFAATMTYYLSLKAPLASPALTGAPTTPLAALFDDSSQLASTAFVRRFGNQFGGVGVYTASAQLPATDAGKLIYFCRFRTKPDADAPPCQLIAGGSKLHFQNMAPNQVFVSRAGTDTVQVGGVLTPVVVIPTGGDAYFTRVGTSDWFVNGTAVLDKLASFASLKQPNGWEKSPSGNHSPVGLRQQRRHGERHAYHPAHDLPERTLSDSRLCLQLHRRYRQLLHRRAGHELFPLAHAIAGSGRWPLGQQRRGGPIRFLWLVRSTHDHFLQCFNRWLFDDALFDADTLPADVVEITEKDHQALLQGQSDMKQIVADDNGYPRLLERPTSLPTPAELVQRIDAYAVTQYTYLNRFEVEYRERATAARRYREAGYSGEPGI
nr:hypothetical protein [Pseudomonas sp. BIGb0427]